MPPAMVFVTTRPRIIAPRNSKMAAMKMAWLRVNAPEPTDVPKALATSFEPVPHPALLDSCGGNA